MSDEKNNKKQPVHTWLPKVLLTFLVFGALLFVVYQVTGGMTEDLGDKSMWALLVAMVLLVLLPVVDRIQTLSLSPTGFEATMTEAQAKAIKEVSAMVEDPQAAEVAQAQILQATNTEEVKAAVAQAVELNVTRTVDVITEAIRSKHKCYVRYRPVPDESVQSYHVAPLDIRTGKSAATKAYDYLWAYSYEHESIVSLRLDRVIGVELSEETFDPAEVTTPGKEQTWNVDREW